MSSSLEILELEQFKMMAQMWKLYSKTEIKIDLQCRARFRKVIHFDIVATKDPCSTFGEWEEC